MTTYVAGWTAPTPFEGVADDDVTPLFGLIWWPTNYDPSHKYPVVENIYTGPHASHVPKGFKQALFHHSQAIAELGFICVFIDGRGTGDISKEFRMRSQKNLKDGAGGPDHICMMKQMGAKYPAMDLSRVGVWGHSAGGYDSARAIFDNADWYKVAVSSAGCHDNRMDKASWNEQWMGKIGPHYEDNSNYTAAHKLNGKLLLAHGEVDENVPSKHTSTYRNNLTLKTSLKIARVLSRRDVEAGRGAHASQQRLRLLPFSKRRPLVGTAGRLPRG